VAPRVVLEEPLKSLNADGLRDPGKRATPRLPGVTCAATIAPETRWDGPSQVRNEHSASGHVLPLMPLAIRDAPRGCCKLKLTPSPATR